MEAFEEGAEFMEDIAKAYQNAHGVPLKVAFTQSLMSLLHPIGKVSRLLFDLWPASHLFVRLHRQRSTILSGNKPWK